MKKHENDKKCPKTDQGGVWKITLAIPFDDQLSVWDFQGRKCVHSRAHEAKQELSATPKYKKNDTKTTKTLIFQARLLKGTPRASSAGEIKGDVTKNEKSGGRSSFWVTKTDIFNGFSVFQGLREARNYHTDRDGHSQGRIDFPKHRKTWLLMFFRIPMY